ncbi:adenylate cyclase [Magnetococcus marinus MC-1]|uniref:Adenylate cyclase n=1 Tax=Magnetococcus marinus (strain ATCC BAA-1437 / JCM 17883 / MC-1) TaxID=156889 RepID=A0L5C0_MAGMM|nr:CYTH domain-containing protein [Magnetococcus marinus]ABK43163.1 adenylate cyclase [Magnetococcus marinus MC-1]
MSFEIERKFLLSHDGWRGLATGTLYRQGFLSTDKERVVRVRIAGDRGSLTIKGLTRGAKRREFEYEIPLDEAALLLDELCHQPLIEKHRYCIPHGQHMWEVDEFIGENAGLLIAEVELSAEDESVELPDWVGQEVTEDHRYANASLVSNPYRRWSTEG